MPLIAVCWSGPIAPSLGGKKKNPTHAEMILFHLKRLQLMHMGSMFTESRVEKPRLLLEPGFWRGLIHLLH